MSKMVVIISKVSEVKDGEIPVPLDKHTDYGDIRRRYGYRPEKGIALKPHPKK